MAVRRQDDQHEHTFSSYVRIRDVVLKTCLNDREEWRERVRDIRATSTARHYKLICSYLCSAEQNDKTSLKNNNEWFIFMIEVDLCQSEKRFFLGYQIAVLQVACQFFSVLLIAALVLLCV